MVTLSDYLGYLNKQFIEARRQADLASVAMAKAYAADEYLQHFKVPRFTIPVIKLKVPIKIDLINQETRYDFELNPKDFIGQINKNFALLARKFGIKLMPFGEEEFEHDRLQKYFNLLRDRSNEFVRDVDHVLSYDEVASIYLSIFPRDTANGSQELPPKLLEALIEVLYQAIKTQFRPKVSNISNMAITPQASGLNQDDSDKLLLHLDLEVVDEAIQIRKMTNADGQIVEEIMVD